MTEILQLILANWKHEKQAFFVNNVTVHYLDAIYRYKRPSLYTRLCLYIEVVHIHTYGIQGNLLWNTSQLYFNSKIKKFISIFIQPMSFIMYRYTFLHTSKTIRREKLSKICKKKNVKILQDLESGKQNLKYRRT